MDVGLIQKAERQMMMDGKSASEIDAMKSAYRKQVFNPQGYSQAAGLGSFASGGEAYGPPPVKGPDPQGIGENIRMADGGEVMNGIGTLNETARNMTRGPRGIGAYQQFADGGEGVRPQSRPPEIRPQSRPPEIEEMAEIRNYLGSFSDESTNAPLGLRPRSRPEKYFEINSYDINGETQNAIDFKDGMRMFMPDVENMITSNRSATEPMVGRETGQEVLDFLEKNNPTSEEFIDYFSSARLAGGGAVPRQTMIQNQPHMLAYINPEEERMLRDAGGTGQPGPGGIPAYPHVQGHLSAAAEANKAAAESMLSVGIGNLSGTNVNNYGVELGSAHSTDNDDNNSSAERLVRAEAARVAAANVAAANAAEAVRVSDANKVAADSMLSAGIGNLSGTNLAGSNPNEIAADSMLDAGIGTLSGTNLAGSNPNEIAADSMLGAGIGNLSGTNLEGLSSDVITPVITPAITPVITPVIPPVIPAVIPAPVVENEGIPFTRLDRPKARDDALKGSGLIDGIGSFINNLPTVKILKGIATDVTMGFRAGFGDRESQRKRLEEAKDEDGNPLYSLFEIDEYFNATDSSLERLRDQQENNSGNQDNDQANNESCPPGFVFDAVLGQCVVGGMQVAEQPGGGSPFAGSVSSSFAGISSGQPGEPEYLSSSFVPSERKFAEGGGVYSPSTLSPGQLGVGAFAPTGRQFNENTASQMASQMPNNRAFQTPDQMGLSGGIGSMGDQQMGPKPLAQYGQYLEQTYGQPDFEQKRTDFLNEVAQKEQQTFGPDQTNLAHGPFALGIGNAASLAFGNGFADGGPVYMSNGGIGSIRPKSRPQDFKVDERVEEKNEARASLMETIYDLESNSDYNKWNLEAKNKPKTPLTSMTVREIMNYQKDDDGPAAGAGQIKHDTLEYLIDNGYISSSDVFSPEVQDKAVIRLLDRRGFVSWFNGETPTEEFGSDMAKEFASLPLLEARIVKGKARDRGQSRYANNTALMGADSWQDVLESSINIPQNSGKGESVPSYFLNEGIAPETSLRPIGRPLSIETPSYQEIRPQSRPESLYPAMDQGVEAALMEALQGQNLEEKYSAENMEQQLGAPQMRPQMRPESAPQMRPQMRPETLGIMSAIR